MHRTPNTNQGLRSRTSNAKTSDGSNFGWLIPATNVNQSKKWAEDVSQKVCIRGLVSGSAHRNGLHSETKIEPDLRLTDHWINALKKKNHNI